MAWSWFGGEWRRMPECKMEFYIYKQHSQTGFPAEGGCESSFEPEVDSAPRRRINLYSAWRLVLNHHPSLVGGRRRHANSFCQVRETESYKCKFGNELLWWSCSFNDRSIQIFFMVPDLSTTMWASRNDRQPSDSESIISFQLWHSVIFLTPFSAGPTRGSASVLICMTVSGCSRSRILAAKGRSHLSGPFSDDAGYGARMMNGGHRY